MKIKQEHGEAKYKLKTWLKKIRKPINLEREKKKKRYTDKINHYRNKQKEASPEKLDLGKKHVTPTRPPSRLSQYSSLSIL